MKIEIGNLYRLKDYEEHSDFLEHNGQICEIISLVSAQRGLFEVGWRDGESSYVEKDNLIPVIKETQTELQ